MRGAVTSFLLLRGAAAFTSVPYQSSNYSGRSILHSRSSDTDPLNEASETFLIITGNTNEALGAAMALCAKGELLNSKRDNQTKRSLLPPSQMIAFFDTPIYDDRQQHRHQQQRRPHALSSDTLSSLQNAIYFLGGSSGSPEQMISHALQVASRISRSSENDNNNISLMLHTSLHSNDKSKFDVLSLTRNRFSFVGLNVETDLTPNGDGRIILLRDDAEELGNKLQTLLNGESISSSAAVTMDIRSHLAMLQANSLPRSRGALGINYDVWAFSDCIKDGIHVDNEDSSLLLEYNYDYSDKFGGCDPLLRAGNGYWISPSSSDFLHKSSKDAFSAAYTAMMGSGMDPVSSLCIANGVKRVFHKLGRLDETTYHPPSYRWITIDLILQYSQIASKSVAEVNGLARKMYKEFGYR